MILNFAHLVRLGKTSALNSIVLCPMLERILVRLLLVGFLKRMRIGILTFTAFCFLKKMNSRYLETKRDNSEYSPPEEDVGRGYWLVFGGVEGKFDDIAEHFKSRMKKTGL